MGRPLDIVSIVLVQSLYTIFQELQALLHEPPRPLHETQLNFCAYRLLSKYINWEFVGLFTEWYAGGKWDAARAPLCKGSCREATEGLCSTVLQFRKCFGETAGGNDFAVESSVFDGTSAKRGQNGHGTFGRWAHREVCHYNPSVSFADSSPYTGEPLPRTASTRTPRNKQLHKFPICRFAELNR